MRIAWGFDGTGRWVGRGGGKTPVRATVERSTPPSAVRIVPIKEHLAWLRAQGREDEVLGIRRIPQEEGTRRVPQNEGCEDIHPKDLAEREDDLRREES